MGSYVEVHDRLWLGMEVAGWELDELGLGHWRARLGLGMELSVLGVSNAAQHLREVGGIGCPTLPEVCLRRRPAARRDFRASHGANRVAARGRVQP